MDVTGAQVTVDPGMLEAVVRDNLNITARRDVVVTQPLKVTEVGRREKRGITVPDFPNKPDKGNTRSVFNLHFTLSEATAKRRWSLGLGISDCVLDRLSASAMLASSSNWRTLKRAGL